MQIGDVGMEGFYLNFLSWNASKPGISTKRKIEVNYLKTVISAMRIKKQPPTAKY